MKRRWLTALLLLVAAYGAVIIAVDRRRATPAVSPDPPSAEVRRTFAQDLREHLASVETAPDLETAYLEAEDSVLRTAARRAWRFVDRNWIPGTGLVRGVNHYPVATVWDIGSGVAAHVAAREIGLLDEDEYSLRMDRMLNTLGRLPLHRGLLYNKRYNVETGALVGPEDANAPEGYGWSALDHGRLLAALALVARLDPERAPNAREIVRRIAVDSMLLEGRLRGERATRSDGGTIRQYQEGRLGYEQYAARAVAAWGFDPGGAAHLEPVTQMVRREGEVPGFRDIRGDDCITSEPFLLTGLELGWQEEEQLISEALLRAQAKRSRDTGRPTAWSEETIGEPPYFLYGCVWRDGESFRIIDPWGRAASNAPVFATKAAFGWYALRPTHFTVDLVHHVLESTADLWDIPGTLSEDTSRPAGGASINSAATLLEAVAYVLSGRQPLAPTTDDNALLGS